MNEVEPPDPAVQIVRLQWRSGETRYLLEARKERCPECPHGTRVISVWVGDPRTGDPRVAELQALAAACMEGAQPIRTGRRKKASKPPERRTADEITWCSHCFNADVRRVHLVDGQRERLFVLRDMVSDGLLSQEWPAARLALDDLDRKGLL